MYKLDTKTNDGIGVSLFLAILFSAISCGLFFTGSQSPELILFITAGILGIIAFFAWANILHYIRKRLTIATPTLAISANQARHGDSLALAYEQKFKRKTRVKKMHMQFVLREQSTYRQGTDTYTVSHDHVIDEIVAADQIYKRGFVLQHQWTLGIPANAMHTFKASNNKLMWLILFNLEYNRSMKSSYQFEIIVLP